MHRNESVDSMAIGLCGRQRAICEHSEMKGTTSTLYAALRGAVNSVISQDCSSRNSQDCGRCYWEINASGHSAGS